MNKTIKRSYCNRKKCVRCTYRRKTPKGCGSDRKFKRTHCKTQKCIRCTYRRKCK